VIDGRFELVDRLGSGGMGLVWRARDLTLHREVALKEVRPPDPAMLAADPTGARMLRERVLREARALARIDHPGVVTIYHIVDAAEVTHPWIVMELVSGPSLQDRLVQGPLTPGEAADIGRGVLSALRAAHAAGIHHRDVKPANVLLRADGRPVLTDFGIAALHESTGLTATGELIGSPDYIAPERIRGNEGNPASDLWSLGMLLYVAVEGRHPLRRSTALATLAAVLDGEIPPPVHSGPLAPVLVSVLNRDTDARPNAAELDRMLASVHARDGFVSGPMDAVPAAYRSTRTTRHTAPAGPGSSTPPSFPASVTPLVGWPEPGPSGSRTRGRAARGMTIAATVAGTTLTGAVLVWALTPGFHDGGTSGASPGSDRSAAGAPADRDPYGPPPGRPPGPPPGPPPENSADYLLSPSAVERVIGKLKPVMGGTEVTKFSVHEGFATAEAPARGNKRLYDTFDYHRGQASRDGSGGTVSEGERTVDLTSFNWNALPGLFRTAENDLGIDKPTGRYVTVDPSSAFADKQPVLLVYLLDDYGGAYLTANTSGKVLDTFPRKRS
jgi:hypothetical protein